MHGQPTETMNCSIIPHTSRSGIMYARPSIETPLRPPPLRPSRFRTGPFRVPLPSVFHHFSKIPLGIESFSISRETGSPPFFPLQSQPQQPSPVHVIHSLLFAVVRPRRDSVSRGFSTWAHDFPLSTRKSNISQPFTSLTRWLTPTQLRWHVKCKYFRCSWHYTKLRKMII